MHFEPVQGPPGPDEGLLGDVLGLGIAAQALGAVPDQALVVERVELAERIGIPCLTSPDELTVALEVHIASDDGHRGSPCSSACPPIRSPYFATHITP